MIGGAAFDRSQVRIQSSCVLDVLYVPAMHSSPVRRPAPLVALAVTTALIAAPVSTSTASPADTQERRPVVVYDSDLDFDDAATLAYLAQEHKRGRIDLQAVTVTNNGVGRPGKALQHARCVLQRTGVHDVPVAEGSPDAPHAFPEVIRDVFDGILDDVTAGCTATAEPADVTAPELIRRVALTNPGTNVIVTGPLSNVATAKLPATTTVTSMSGAIHVQGNLCCGVPVPDEFDNSQEFNAWIDPAATKQVLARGPNVRLIPLDATQDVPITREFIDQLRADGRTPATQLVLDIVTHPDITGFIEDGVMFWWDVLAAMSVVRPNVVEFEEGVVRVVLDGRQAGRTVLVAGHGPLRYGTGADTATFEQRFLDTLNDK